MYVLPGSGSIFYQKVVENLHKVYYNVCIDAEEDINFRFTKPLIYAKVLEYEILAVIQDLDTPTGP